MKNENSLHVANARIVDGTGGPAFAGNVSVRDGRIVDVGPDVSAEAGVPSVDAQGRVLSPGFIDVHTHFDPQICWDRLATPCLEHGVTTVLMGNCSLSLAPVKQRDRRALAGMFKQIEDISIPTFDAGVPWNWETYPEYLDAIRPGLGINVAGLVGHSPLRHYVMGDEAQKREATEAEIAEMSEILVGAIRAGAAGLSTSYVDMDENLQPVASRAASKEEIIALGQAMARAGRGIIQTVPIFFLPDEQLRNMRDMADISRATGLMCTVAPIVHNPTNDLWRDSIALLEAEAKNGARLYGQCMPRTFDVNVRLSEASFMLFAMPAWNEVMKLPLPERQAAFADPGRRDELRNQSVLLGPAWDYFIVRHARDPENQELNGRLLKDIAAERGESPADVMLDLAVREDLETEFCVMGMINGQSEPVGELLQHPLVLVGASDAGAHVAQFCGAGDTSDLLGRWVREYGKFSVERAVHRLTAELADAFGIQGRGRIAAGQAADLVLFDPDTIDRGDEDFISDVPGDANRYVRHATGIDAVVVNGAVVWKDGAYTDARAGEVV